MSTDTMIRAALVLLLGGLLAASVAAAEPPGDMAEVIRAGRAAEEAIASFECVYVVTMEYPSLGRSDIRFVVDEGRVRYEQRPRASTKMGHATGVVAGETELVVKEYSTGSRAALKRRLDGLVVELKAVDFRPPLVAYRAFHPTLGQISADASLVGEEEVGGHPCLVVERLLDSSGFRERYWLATDMSLRPVLTRQLSGDGKLLSEERMEYWRRADGLWEWVKWSFQTYDVHAGGMGCALSAEPVEQTFNLSVPEHEFKIELPEGMRLYDQTDVEDGIQREYVIGTGGEKIPGPPPRPPFGGAPPWAGVTPPRVARRRRRIAMAVGAGVVLAGAAAVYLWRRKRR